MSRREFEPGAPVDCDSIDGIPIDVNDSSTGAKHGTPYAEGFAALQSSVFVIEPVAAVRQDLLSTVSSIGINTESFRSAPEFRRLWIGPKPGCVLLSLGASASTITSHLELQSSLADEHEYLCIIATGAGSREAVFESSRLGAFGFVDDIRNTESLIVQVQTAHEESRRRWEQWQRRREYLERVGCLTRREFEVYQLIMDGLNNKEIASRLGVAVGTTEKHKSTVLKKVHAKNPAHLISAAFAAMGTLRIDDPSRSVMNSSLEPSKLLHNRLRDQRPV